MEASMNNDLFSERGNVARMPRRMRPLGVTGGDWALVAVLLAAVLGLYVLGACIDEPVNPDTEALAVAERAELQARAQVVEVRP
jgi:hypothetical protein